MRTLLAAVLLAGALSADVVVLKDGRRFGGKVVEKGSAYEVTTDAGLRTFLKDEVEKVLTAPSEVLGDSEKLVDEAKKDYQDALGIADAAAQSAKLKEAIAKLTKAREAYATARELFWEDKYSDLDQKLVQIMQLMRLLRERVGSEIAGRPPVPAPPKPTPVEPAPTPALETAFKTLVDAAQRADGSKREAAVATFRAERATSDLAAAAAAFLSRRDADWKLEGAPLAALQDYFAKHLKEPAKLTAASHLDAAKFLAEKFAAAKHESLALFGAGHLGHATAGADADKAAQAFGFVARDGVVGTHEGLAARDLNRWIARGDFDLAAIAYRKEYRGTPAETPGVRLLWSFALVRLAQARKRGFERAVSALNAVNAVDAVFRDHAAALSKSVKNAGVCGLCAGEGKVRCTNCHGRKEVRDDCSPCKGTGAVNSGGGLAPCAPCKGRGYMKLLKCNKCKDGFPTCTRCDGRPRPAPEMEDIWMAAGCAACEGRGTVFAKVAWPCRSCVGLGQKLTPRADPNKILPW